MNVCILFAGLKDQIRKVCTEEYLVCGEGDEQGGAWQEKVIPFSNKKDSKKEMILNTNSHYF